MTGIEIKMKKRYYSPSQCHHYLMKSVTPEMAFDPKEDFKKWQKLLRKRLK